MVSVLVGYLRSYVGTHWSAQVLVCFKSPDLSITRLLYIFDLVMSNFHSLPEKDV